MQHLAIHFKYPTFVSGSLASLPLRISAVQKSLIVASTAFVHAGSVVESESGNIAEVKW